MKNSSQLESKVVAYSDAYTRATTTQRRLRLPHRTSDNLTCLPCVLIVFDSVLLASAAILKRLTFEFVFKLAVLHCNALVLNRWALDILRRIRLLEAISTALKA